MSFCSYEEAWGAPYNSNQKNDHVINNNEIIHENVKNEVLNKHNDVQDDEGMVEVAPLRGSLLGGAIPEEQWKTNELEDSSGDIHTYGSPKYISSLESSFDKKIDQLINKLEKFSQKCNQPNRESQQTTWTDVIVFISLGIAAIFIIDMFFKFGKWIVTSQLSAISQSTRTPPQMIPPHMPQPQMPIRTSVPEPQRYTSYPTMQNMNSPPMYNYRGSVPYYPQQSGVPPPRGI